MFKFNKLFLIIIMISFFPQNVSGEYNELAYNFKFKDLNGNILELSKYKNKVIVVVNVASQCGFTSQYQDMQEIWDKYKNNSVVMLGVPSNDFGQQEPGTNDEIKNFCESKFGISFPMTGKVPVKGPDAHPFYLWAKENYGKSAVPKWNFHKIIIDKKGKVAETFSSITNPTSNKFVKTIEDLIK